MTHGRDPSTGRVVQAQLRLLESPRTAGLLALMLAASYAVVRAGVVGFDMAAAPSVFQCYPLLLVSAVAWAMVVWRDAGSARRDYFWSMPIGRVAHAMARTIAGLVWFVGGLVLLVMIGSAVDRAASGRLLPATYLAWVSLFSGPVTLYLLTSAVAIRSAHPARWALGALIGWSFLHQACTGKSCGRATVAWSLVSDLFGLVSAASGALRSEFVMHRATDTAELPMLIGLWIVLALTGVALAARKQPPI